MISSFLISFCIASPAGWEAYDKKKYKEAIVLFKTGKPDYEGMAWAFVSLKDFSSAEDAALKLTDSEKKTDLLENIAFQSALVAFENKNYDEAISRLSLLPPRLQEDALSVKAWSLYHLGEKKQAAILFEKTYRLFPTAENADALYLALQDDPTLEKKAKNLKGPFQDILREKAAEKALEDLVYREHYQKAFIRSPHDYSFLKGSILPSISAFAEGLWRQGDPGRNRLQGVSSGIEGYIPFGHEHSLKANVTYHTYRTGTPSEGDPIGTPNLPWIISPSNGFKGWELTLDYKRESSPEPQIQLGFSPTGGVIGPRPVGKGQLTFYHRGGAYTSVALSASSKKDSLLSWTGLKDPATGQKWGAVKDYALEGQMYLPLPRAWSLSGKLRGGFLRGTSTVNNHYAEGDVGIHYDFGLKNFEYFALGPGVRHQRFHKNTNFYTLGHGGYFSPQSYTRLGVDLFFLTALPKKTNLKKWILQGTLGLGYETKREDSTPQLPLSSSSDVFDGSSSQGVSLSGELKLLHHIAPRWQWGAFGGFNHSSSFKEVKGGLMLKYIFEDSPAPLVTELKGSSF